jgi:putative molybdopterin biosynthesis protein
LENQVRRRRLAVGLSQSALAERCGLTRQAVSAIEAGQYVPNTVVALRLARALGCTVEELFSLAEAMPRVEAELPEALPETLQPVRVYLARVGRRLLARPLSGMAAAFAAADGLAVPVRPGDPVPRRVAVDLLIDPQLLDTTIVVLGCDPALGVLGAHLARRYPAFRLLWSQASSAAALRLLRAGEAHAAGTHLWDPESGQCNIPYVQRELAGRRVVLITLSEWQQGLIVAAGNPKGLRGPADLARPDVTIVNRERGAGSRTLLDTWLQRAGIAPGQVRGYEREVPSHLAVAQVIAAGGADAGPGILAAARAFGLDFIPLHQERYDLVLPQEYLDSAPIQALLDVAVSLPFRRELDALGGYDSSRTGTIVAEFGP